MTFQQKKHRVSKRCNNCGGKTAALKPFETPYEHLGTSDRQRQDITIADNSFSLKFQLCSECLNEVSKTRFIPNLSVKDAETITKGA